MKIRELALALGFTVLLAGCTTPCGMCGKHPTVVKEKLDDCVPAPKSCDIPCVPAPTNTGLDGW